MALPLQELVRVGFDIAKQLVPDAFKSSIVRLNPTTVVDPVTDAAATTWQSEITTDLFGYDDEDERKVLPLNVKQRTFLLNAADYPPGIPFTQDAQVSVDGIKWEIYRAEIAPGATVVILFGRA